MSARIDHSHQSQPNPDLTPRELEIVGLVAGECMTTKEIANRLGISPHTVEMHRENASRKMKWRTVMEMCRWWWQGPGKNLGAKD